MRLGLLCKYFTLSISYVSFWYFKELAKRPFTVLETALLTPHCSNLTGYGEVSITAFFYKLSQQALSFGLFIVDRDMIWKLGKLQSAYNELRFDVGTVLTVHKSFVFRLLVFKQHC